MIIFQTETAQLDLTHLKLTLTEESNWFVNDTLQDYSKPFRLDFENSVAQKLGLPHIKNISNYNSVILGTLIIDDNFYKSYIKIGDIKGNYAEATLFYGDDVLPVFSTPLKNLNWPTIVTTSLSDYAATIIDKGYPEVTHNFPTVYRPSIKEKEDYADFNNFVNKYSAVSGFLANQTVVDGETTTFKNYNVISPHVYMLEILRFAYSLEGKEVRGELFESNLFKSVVYMPDRYFERFLSNQYDSFQFGVASKFQVENNIEQAVFERVYTPTLLGTYEFKFNVNLSATQAATFSLKITIKDTATQTITTIYEAVSKKTPINIKKELEINIDTDNVFDQIKIELIIPRQQYTMAPFNSFEFNYKEGRLNVFPKIYSLADFMPDMTFGDYQNKIKNWLNLDIYTNDNIVYFDFLENKINNLEHSNKSHLEDPEPKHKLNTDRFFKLKYQNGDVVNIDATGQVFTEANEHQEVIDLDIDVFPAKIEENFGILTTVFAEDAEGLRFGLYNGIQPGQNVMVDNINNEDLSLQQIKDKYWIKWLHFRTNSKTFKEAFKAHVSEIFDIRKAQFKYNELHLIKKNTKSRESAKFWKITSETETL